MIRFFYNPRKAAQAAAQLVQLNGGTMDLYALMKILYLADRKALVHRGRPITGDNMVSMPYGPVLSRILDEFIGGDSIFRYDQAQHCEVGMQLDAFIRIVEQGKPYPPFKPELLAAAIQGALRSPQTPLKIKNLLR